MFNGVNLMSLEFDGIYWDEFDVACLQVVATASVITASQTTALNAACTFSPTK